MANTSDRTSTEGENRTSKWYINAKGLFRIEYGTLADQLNDLSDDAIPQARRCSAVGSKSFLRRI